MFQLKFSNRFLPGEAERTYYIQFQKETRANHHSQGGTCTGTTGLRKPPNTWAGICHRAVNAHIWEKISLGTLLVFMFLCSIIKPQNHNSLNQMLTANVGMASLKENPLGNTSLTEKGQRDLGIITHTKMNRSHTSIQLPSKICILVCLWDGVSHKEMYAVQQGAAMAQVFIGGWTLPTSLSCGCFSHFLSLQPF